MAREALATKIRRLYSINEKKRELEAEERELKDWFKGQADGNDVAFEAPGYVVKVTGKSRAGGLDKAKLVAEYGAAVVKKFLKPDTRFLEVTVSKVAK